ncbi:MAG: type III-B CRISPR module RAMP protein Cmr6 [Deltaproteobacteria bacterium]|nr:type III-B CRISPR module RAMP protein Cmr6 [Deltaproteobacteria bacterium]
MTARRQVFDTDGYLGNQPPSTANRGLWLDRFLASMESAGDDHTSPKTEHLRASQHIGIPDGYKAFADHRREAILAIPHTRLLRLRTRGRSIVGIGRATPWENSLTLHHTWGVPLVPGSSLKGLAASYAHKTLEGDAWRRRLAEENNGGGDFHNLLFGTTDERGLVVVHDALWAHDAKETSCGLHLDTITVHHPNYYQSGTEAPTDLDSPVPIPFLSFHGDLYGAISWAGGDASDATIDRWLDIAVDILKEALDKEGVGAKTSSGYGRMDLDVEKSEADKARDALDSRIKGFRFPTEPGGVSKIDREIDELIKRDDAPALLARFVARVASLGDKKAQKIAKERITERAAKDGYELLRAVLPAAWREAANKDKDADANELVRLKAELAAHDAEKPGKKDKKMKAWRKKYDKLKLRIAALEKKLAAD